MAAPSLTDGVSRGLSEFALPPVVILTLVGIVRVGYGKSEAGILYLLVTIGVFIGIYTSAKYWNIRYTLGFVTTGLVLWFGIPGIIPQLVPPIYANLSSLAALIFLVGLAHMLINKF